MCVSWPAVPPSLSLSLVLLIPWDTTVLKSGQLITLQWPLNERKNLRPFTLNQKLDMIKINKEGVLEVEIGWKLGLLCQLAKLWMQRKNSWRKLVLLLQWTHEWERKWNSLIADMEKVWVVWIEDPANHKIPLSQNLIQSKALTLFNYMKLREVKKLQKKSLKLTGVGSWGWRKEDISIT